METMPQHEMPGVTPRWFARLLVFGNQIDRLKLELVVLAKERE